MRCAVELAGDHSAHLRELFHQVRLRVQPAGGVHDHHVTAVARRRLDRVVCDGGRIGAPFALDEHGRSAVGPDLELLLGCSAERIRCGEHDGVSVLAQSLCELADRRRLAGPVHPDDEQDARLPLDVERPRVAEERGDLLRKRRVQVADLAARFEPADELRRRAYADIRTDQCLLEPLPR